MKIGIVAIHPFNGSLGTMDVISETSKELSKMGLEIHIFTPFEENKSNDNIFIHKIPSVASTIGLKDNFYSLMRRFYSSSFIARNLILRKSTIEASVNSLEKKLLPLLKELDIDILQGEQDIPSLVCTRLGKKLGKPTIAHIRNFWPEECVDIGLMKRNSDSYRVLHQLVGDIVNDSDLVFTVSKFAKNFLINEYGISKAKIAEIPRGAHPFERNRSNEKKEPSVVYSGSISPHENLSLFIKSMPLILQKSHDCAFYFTGKGPYLSKIKQTISQSRINASFLWFEQKTDLQNFLSQCSLGVIPWANTFSRRFGFPIKLLNYLSVGLPVVTTEIGEWADIVRKEELGIVTQDFPESLSQGILYLLDNPSFAENCGKKGADLIKKTFNWTNTAKIMANFYEHLS